jgi:hypothetical protein
MAAAVLDRRRPFGAAGLPAMAGDGQRRDAMNVD